MKGSDSNVKNNGELDWELRPGGMLVQKREDEDDESMSCGPLIKIKVSHGTNHHDVTVPAQSTFGDLKKAIAHETGLEPKEQRLLFRGKEKEDDECLHMVGVKDLAKVILLEDPASKEKKKVEETRRDPQISRACEAISKVRTEVDNLSKKVAALEAAVHGGTKVAEKEFVILTELLMVQLLKLDSIEAEGEARAHRKIEVRRIQSFVETLDTLKARNTNPFSKNGVSVSTKWETFGSGMGSLSAPPPMPSSLTQDWQQFD